MASPSTPNQNVDGQPLIEYSLPTKKLSVNSTWLEILEELNRQRAEIEILKKSRAEHNYSEKPYPKQQENPSGWKEEPATKKQLAFLTTHSIPFSYNITKGEASEKIERAIDAMKKAKA